MIARAAGSGLAAEEGAVVGESTVRRLVARLRVESAQESFLDGHVRAFEALGGVPTGMIRYDNLMR